LTPAEAAKIGYIVVNNLGSLLVGGSRVLSGGEVMGETMTVNNGRGTTSLLSRSYWRELCLALVLVGCSAPRNDDYIQGTLSMQLSTEVNGVTYRLREALFEVSGPESLPLSSGDSPAIEQLLTAGDYTVNLSDGWRLEREFPMGFQTVAAELVSPNPAPFTVAAGRTTDVTYAFETDGTVVTLGEGTLNLRIQVTETSSPPTPAEVGGDLEGFLHLSPCSSPDFGHDCAVPGCEGGSKTTVRTLQLGGELGVIYDVSLHVYGVVEPRRYQGGLRRAGATSDPNGLDFWHEGGALPANPGTFNSYELHVEPQVPGAANDYFLNSRPGNEQQLVVRLDYTATVAVPGGGTIQFRSFDLNCRQITNCSTTECGPLTPKPLITASVMNADPPPPPTFVQPFQTSANAGRGQWVYIDVTSVVARP
jgi:hypothetical protein